MQKKDLRTGALLAMRTSKYNTLVKVRLLDVSVWRMSPAQRSQEDRSLIPAAGERVRVRSGYGRFDYGYPALTRILTHTTAMTPDEHRAANAFMANAEVQLSDLLDKDGRQITELPRGVLLTVVDTRHLVGGWATVKGAEDAQEAAEEEVRQAQKERREDRENRFGLVRQIAQKILGNDSPYADPRMSDTGVVTMSLEDFEAIMARVR